MNTYKTIALIMAAAALAASPVQAQTSSQDLFLVKFHATCKPADSSNKGSNKMDNQDLIEQCVGTGFSKKELKKNFALVYNPTTDSIQVVNASDGSPLCDIFQFQGGTNATSGNQLERFTFVFSPNQAEAIGSAVISEKSTGNSKKAKIKGNIQFTMTVPGTSFVTGDSTLTGETATTNDTHGLTDTNVVTDTSGGDSTSDNVNTGFVQASAAADSASPGEVAVCTGTFNAGARFEPGQSTVETNVPSETPGTGEITPPEGNTNNVSSTNTVRDIRFVTEAAQDSLKEIQTGQLAMQNSTNQAVIAFGQQLVNDHTQALNDLTQIANAKGIEVPTSLDAVQQKAVNALTDLQGQTFDTAFLKEEVASHRASIKVFQTEADHGDDADLQAYAQNTVPMLQQHLDQALQLQ